MLILWVLALEFKQLGFYCGRNQIYKTSTQLYKMLVKFVLISCVYEDISGIVH